MIPDSCKGVPWRRQSRIRWGLFLAGTAILGGLHHWVGLDSWPRVWFNAFTGMGMIALEVALDLPSWLSEAVAYPLLGYLYFASLLWAPCFNRYRRHAWNLLLVPVLFVAHLVLQAIGQFFLPLVCQPHH